jgi:hypothetical protein
MHSQRDQRKPSLHQHDANRRILMCMAEKTPAVRITVTLPESVVQTLDEYAEQHRWSRSTAAAVLLEQGLSDQEEQRGK